MIRLLALVPVLIWLYLLTGRGGFYRLTRILAPPLAAPPRRRIVAVIPARNEAAVIAQAVGSLLRQYSGGSLHVVVVDDGSTDGTAAAARWAAAAAGAERGLTVIQGANPPADWTGKLWAMSQGVAAAEAHIPDYLLLTDADIRHEPGNLAALVAQAETGGFDLVSCMVRLSTATLADRCLIPAFVFFFFMLYPPAWVARRKARTAAAAGGCMLLRPEALRRAGGLGAIRGQLIDDCALARAIKGAGGRIWLGLTRSALSQRAYGSFAEVGAMISRSAFNQLRHSYALLVLTVLGLAVTYVAPVVLIAAGDPVTRACGAVSWALMSLAYLPMIRFYGLNPLWSVCLPAIALFYLAASVHSAAAYARGRGGVWKGRVQDRRAG